MDKLILTEDDIIDLFNWRDDHKIEVRNHPASLRALEIIAPDVGWSVKGIREGDELELHANQNGQSLGCCKFTRLPDGYWKSTKNRMRTDREHLESLLSIYCTVMAVMAYGWQKPDNNEPPKKHKRNTAHKSNKRSKLRRSTSVTYILQRNRKAVSIMPEGQHASPSGEFTVRGHYRHYASGKVVWIAEYKKGTGKKKSKTYKLGGKKDGH